MDNDYFFDKNTWSINQDNHGVKISPFTALMITPIMGGLFLMSLPVIGFYLAIKFFIDKIADGIKRLVYASFVPSPVPGRIHLTGHELSEDKPEKIDGALDELQREIDDFRK